MQIKSYLKETLARITGNADKVIAEKNYRKATAAIKGQLASLEATLVNAEDELETANEALNDASYPTILIGASSNYIEGLAMAQDNVDAAQDHVKDVKASIEFYKRKLAEFDQEVEAAA